MQNHIVELLHEIMDAKLTDNQFLKIIEDLPLDPLTRLGEMLKEERNQLRQLQKTYVKKYKDTGIPVCPKRFSKIKFKRNVREKQVLMLRHKRNKLEAAA